MRSIKRNAGRAALGMFTLLLIHHATRRFTSIMSNALKRARKPLRISRGLRALIVLPLLASCAARHAPPATVTRPAPQPPALPTAAAAPVHSVPATPREHRVGTVRVIGSGERFVLIEVPPTGAGALPDGQLLRCSAAPAVDAPATATLRVARERRQPFIVADVVDGSPQVGDTVYAVPMAPPAPAPPTILPTATAGVLPIVLPPPVPAAKTP